jgi:hypothetical protein
MKKPNQEARNMVEILQGELVYLFEGRGDVDQTEGRGGTRCVGWYLSRKDAENAVKNEGVMGTPGYVKSHQALAVRMDNGDFQYYKIEKLEVETVETARQRALAKLTPEEKKLLGL